MFTVITTTLADAVATNGTFAVGYPAGKSSASYVGAHAHKLSALQTIYNAPASFTLAFGASSITVTYLGATTLPAGTLVTLQVDQLGTDDRQPEKALVNDRIGKAPLMLLDLGAPLTADADGVSASQTVTGAGTAFLINGALALNGVVTLDTPRNIVAAWTNTAVLTIAGTDVDGNTVVEKSASGTSHTGKKAFKTVTSVTTSATVTGATVGTGVVLGLPVYLPDASAIVAELESGVAMPRKPRKIIYTSRVLCTDGTYGVVHVPFAGTVKSIKTVEVDGGITTNDAVLTFKIGTTGITTGVVTVATAASAAGVKDSCSPTAANVLAAGDAINVTVSGTPGGSKSVQVSVEVELSNVEVLSGTFVAGVTSAATATTGDTRGTYAPSSTPNGVITVALLASVPAPDDYGVPQYTG